MWWLYDDCVDRAVVRERTGRFLLGIRDHSGPNGSPCSNPLPFDPSLTTGSLNIQAGAFTPFTMTMSREDGNQNLDAIQLKMPPGLLGELSKIKLCEEAQANAGRVVLKA